MTIKNLLEALEMLKEDIIIQNINLESHGSDRGNYEDFYIGLNSKVSNYTVKDLKDFLRNKVIGHTFTGYKGGDFEMDEYTTIRLGSYGCSGEYIDGILINENGVELKVQKVLYY